jgi:hypothetical protein
MENLHLEVTLVFGPPAEHPTRLRLIDVRIARGSFAGAIADLDERQVVRHLGKPRRVGDDQFRGRQLDYEGDDAAGIGLWYVWLGQHEIVFRAAPR